MCGYYLIVFEEEKFMPICFAECGKDLVIRQIAGSDKIKKHLENLGFVVGETIQVVNKVNNNVIVRVKGVKMAISDELARRILV